MAVSRLKIFHVILVTDKRTEPDEKITSGQITKIGTKCHVCLLIECGPPANVCI